MTAKELTEILMGLTGDLGELLDKCHERALQKLGETEPGTPEHVQADACEQAISELIGSQLDLKLKILDLQAKQSGLIDDLKAKAKAAEYQANQVAHAKDKVDQVTKLLDQVTKLLGVVAKFV